MSTRLNVEEITTAMAELVADETPALAAETALEYMENMDSDSKQRFLSVLLAQTYAIGSLDGELEAKDAQEEEARNNLIP